ncbi:sugar ABC transporter ATP-binding protein [Streptomyces sp. NBC_00878]|uniref:sugar ABC transporter ATP-binding protein n=1 Tax=Streptomyces sp. NBC_00878 TaxID=2975854 RepID=UPI002251CD4A|nr:sugar ABC transporter ATP-binding protein [Streptomyces sp. NBC_00878]MCX4903841.1 sugar ABC transporter ATP-binding protein [Streptomyces sp. NBC_00878]
MSPDQARLEIHSLSKTFRTVRVLDDVNLSVRPGEVHGLAGQNGSGKSTLIKILTGVYSPDPGAQYHVDGRPVRLPVRWREVRAAGVGVVHQDLGLLDQLTVAENVCVGGFPTRLGRIDRIERDRLTARTLARLGIELEPATVVGTLSAPERAEIAIARAMRDHAAGAGLIILDESTRALSGDDLTRIHQMLRRIASQGSAALLISHSLSELVAVCDRLTILRDGKVTGDGLNTSHLSEHGIARRMLGSAPVAGPSRPPAREPAGRPTVHVRGVRGKRVEGVDFDVHDGEILGITGLPGNGYEELPYLLAGAQRAIAGKVVTPQGLADLRHANVIGCLRAGIVLVPERRDRDGLAFDLNLRDNISLPLLKARGRPWFVARTWQRQAAEKAIDTLGIRPNAPTMTIKHLSGGNQQKVLLAKWLATAPAALVLHEPTQAVDVGARQDILRALRRAAESGMAVVLVSSEPEILVEACDRVLIYRSGGGTVVADCSSADVLIEQIYAAAEKSIGEPA